ncbi:hypothetical protein [Fischerella sp. PCC 9605]|uniref:hypothetical protein n=1 Tax=Fischerella sp. PCC 9605 TaxID=1173024 RepID=UPI0004B1EC04|nr:hypothetical protein [Fischerella sp. PCC 9605]
MGEQSRVLERLILTYCYQYPLGQGNLRQGSDRSLDNLKMSRPSSIRQVMGCDRLTKFII